MNQYRWVYQPYTPQSPRAAELAEEFHISPVYAALLLNRGLEMEEELQAFVQPAAETLAPPQLLTDMDKAANIIREAVQQQKNIVVYGDYDVDGITSTALFGTIFAQNWCESGILYSQQNGRGLWRQREGAADVGRKKGAADYYGGLRYHCHAGVRDSARTGNANHYYRPSRV